MRMENREPFITIGIASYNYANYLPEAFEAIRNQKFRDFEILYCDDGSTDESVEVIKGFIRDNPDLQIRLVEAENQGIIANKNRDLMRKVEVVSKRTIREKLMTYLAMCAKEKGSDSFEIPFDRQELADYLEVDRSGLSAEISKLRREGILKSEKKQFTLLL